MTPSTPNYVNLHWLTGSTHLTDLTYVKAEIENFVRATLWEEIIWDEGVGVNGYQKSLRYMDYVWLVYDVDREFAQRIHNSKMSVIFKGCFFDRLGYEKLKEFGELVQKLGLTVTRIDQYYQDVERVREIYDIYQDFNNGCCKGFQAKQYRESGSKNGKTGETLELGKRGKNGSGKFLRIYDKTLESKGDEEGIRWEVEWANKRADAAWDILIRSEFNKETFVGMIFSTCDWVYGTTDHHRDRWERLEWYQKLIDTAQRVVVPVPRRETNIDKKVSWITQSVSGSLEYTRAFCHFIDGCDDGFDGLMGNVLEVGKSKLKKQHYQQLQNDIAAYLEGNLENIMAPSLEDIQAFCEGIE